VFDVQVTMAPHATTVDEDLISGAKKVEVCYAFRVLHLDSDRFGILILRLASCSLVHLSAGCPRNIGVYVIFLIINVCIVQADIRSKMEETMLDPEKLQQFAITGADADFDEALGSGKLPKSGYVSVKSAGAKLSDGKDHSKGGKAGKAGKEKRKKVGDFKRPGGKRSKQ